MKRVVCVTGLGVVALATSSSLAGTRTIEMVIQSDTFDNFQFSVLHSASSNGGESGNILGGFTGRFTIEVDDVAETIEFTSFRGDISGTSRSDDIKLAADPSRGASMFSMDPGTNLIAGNLKLDIFDGGTFKDADFNFDPTAFNSLANQFFEQGEDPQGSNRETLGLWGLSQQLSGGESLLGDTNQIGIDLVGRAIPMPTPIAMASLGLVGVAGVRRRR